MDVVEYYRLTLTLNCYRIQIIYAANNGTLDGEYLMANISEIKRTQN